MSSWSALTVCWSDHTACLWLVLSRLTNKLDLCVNSREIDGQSSPERRGCLNLSLCDDDILSVLG
jgi:hypothetical protein